MAMDEKRIVNGIELVECGPRHSWLREAACVADWRHARKHPDPGDARFACVGCAVGCARAGEAPEQAQADLNKPRRLCVRCHRSADRLIYNRICLSCYNRAREAAIGRDRRGRVPRNVLATYTASMWVISERGTRPLNLECVASTLEAALIVRRQHQGLVYLSRRVQPIMGQQRLFG